MKRMGWTAGEVEASPAWVIEAVLVDAQAEGEAAKTREAWSRR